METTLIIIFLPLIILPFVVFYFFYKAEKEIRRKRRELDSQMANGVFEGLRKGLENGKYDTSKIETRPAIIDNLTVREITSDDIINFFIRIKAYERKRKILSELKRKRLGNRRTYEQNNKRTHSDSSNAVSDL